jgi:hypothetical protein
MTYDDIVSVLGSIDDDLAAGLIATGASVELREAWNWLNNDEALMGEGRPLPDTRVSQLIDLLEPDDDGVD